MAAQPEIDEATLRRHLSQAYIQCKKAIQDLKKAISVKQFDNIEKDGASLRKHMRSDISKETNNRPLRMEQRHQMKGHYGKIYAIDWGTNNMIASCGQDEKIILWDGSTGLKTAVISELLTSRMSIKFSPDASLLASGGLDNGLSILRTSDEEVISTLHSHEGFISNCAFLSNHEIISASGDGTCILWDIERERPIVRYTAHTQDILSLDVALSKDMNGSHHTFISGSMDKSIKYWDLRVPQYSRKPSMDSDNGSPSSSPRNRFEDQGSCVLTLFGHDGDVNSVRWFPTRDHTLGSGGEDGTVRLWDLRAARQMNIYQCGLDSAMADDADATGVLSSVTSVSSVEFSYSGYLIYAGFDEGPYCQAWKTGSAETYAVLPHQLNVSSIVTSPDGYGVVTACWDTFGRIWA